MRVTIQWDDEEQCIIRYDFAEGWSFADYFRAGDQAKIMIADKGYGIDLIFNLLHPRFPPGVIKEGQRLTEYIPSGTKTIAIVGASMLYQRLGHIMGTLFPKYASIYVYANTLEQAREMIIERRLS